MTRVVAGAIVMLCGLCAAPGVSAHSGPPYPIVTDSRVMEPYVVSVWTDPDTTNDGTAGGRFWVVLSADTHGAVPPVTRATMIATSLTGTTASVDITPAERDGRTHVGAFVFDREGPYRVEIQIIGPPGTFRLETQVDATYDLRPSPLTAWLYLVPFALIGLLWMRMLIRRSRSAKGPGTETAIDVTSASVRTQSGKP